MTIFNFFIFLSLIVFPYLLTGTGTSSPAPATISPNCYNGGLFVNNSKCLCQGLFEGTKCEILKCVSGGYLDSTTNRCKCPKGYVGLHCEGFIRHPKPKNIFKSDQTTLNIFIFEDCTEYYGKLGLSVFKEKLINHVKNNENKYNNFLIGYDYSQNTNNYVSKSFSQSNDFINYINTTIKPQKPNSYSCYTVNFYQTIIQLIKSSKIENSPFVIYTQHPPNDYEMYKNELENLAIAFKIRFTILFQNDLSLDGCDETEDIVSLSFSALKDLAFLSGGIFYQLNSDTPQSGIQHFLDILYNPQMVSYTMNNDCSKGITLNYQSDLFVSSGHLIIQSDTPIDMTKQIISSFNIISYSYDNKTITLSSNQMSETKPGADTLNIQNIPGKCSIQLLSLYPSSISQNGIDIYYSYIPSNIINKDGKDSGYIIMRENTQNIIHFNVEKQKHLQQFIFSPNQNNINVTKGSFVKENSNINFMNILNEGNTIFGYTLGDDTNTFSCQINERSWFVVVVEILFPGSTLYYQRYIPVKCFVPPPVTTTTTTTSTTTTQSTTLYSSTQSFISSSTVSGTSTEQTTILPTTQVPPTRTTTFGLVASCGVDYSIAMPYLNGIASLTQTNLSDTFYNNGYLFFSDNVNQTSIPTYYDSFTSFIYNVRTFKQHCVPVTVTSYIGIINSAIQMIKDDKFQKNSPLILLPTGGSILTPNSGNIIRPLIELAVAKRISIYVLVQYNLSQFKSIDMFSQLVKATNGHMFMLNHNLQLPNDLNFAQNTITDFFTNIYPNTLIQSRSITNDYSIDNYGEITITDEKDIIVTISSDALSSTPTNGYMLNVRMIDNQGNAITQSLKSFNNSNVNNQYSNYEYVIFKKLPSNTYRISLQAFIYPINQISVRIWEVVDIYNNYNFIDISYLSILSNNTLSNEIVNGPNSDNGIILHTNIFVENNHSDISNITLTFHQLIDGPSTDDILISPINFIYTSNNKELSSTKIEAIFNPIIDLRPTNLKNNINTPYPWPIYKTDIKVLFNNNKQQTYTFNTFIQGDYTEFIPNINYQDFKQGKNEQFYYCENNGYLKYDYTSNGYQCICSSNYYSGNSCEKLNQCQEVTNYPGKNDDTYRILTVVLATSNLTDSFYEDTLKLFDKFTINDIQNLWQFRLYYYNNKNLISYYIGSEFSTFQKAFKNIIQQNPTSDYVCISEIKNTLYHYLPSGVKGLVWLVTDEGIISSTPSPISTTLSTLSTPSPIDFNCPDDITNGYNQDLFYIYHENNDDDYIKNKGKYIFNGGGPLKFINSQDYVDVSYYLLQKLFSGDISTNNHLEALTNNFKVNIEQSKEAFALILGESDSQLTNPTTSIVTSKYVSIYSVKDQDSITPDLSNSFSVITTYVINGYNVDVAYLRSIIVDEPSNVPVIGNLTYALYPPPSIQDINLISDSTNAYKTERNGCSYKYTFTQQTSSNTQDKLQFKFKNTKNEEYIKVYPNNQVYNSIEVLKNQTSLPTTCRNGKYVLNTNTSSLNLYYCLCEANFRGTDCSIPICQNNGKLNGMQNDCDCSSTNYYGEFCENIILNLSNEDIIDQIDKEYIYKKIEEIQIRNELLKRHERSLFFSKIIRGNKLPDEELRNSCLCCMKKIILMLININKNEFICQKGNMIELINENVIQLYQYNDINSDLYYKKLETNSLYELLKLLSKYEFEFLSFLYFEIQGLLIVKRKEINILKRLLHILKICYDIEKMVILYDEELSSLETIYIKVSKLEINKNKIGKKIKKISKPIIIDKHKKFINDMIKSLEKEIQITRGNKIIGNEVLLRLIENIYKFIKGKKRKNRKIKEKKKLILFNNSCIKIESNLSTNSNTNYDFNCTSKNDKKILDNHKVTSKNIEKYYEEVMYKKLEAEKRILLNNQRITYFNNSIINDLKNQCFFNEKFVYDEIFFNDNKN
uniref:EGF-like domain-containing protein n=1 Tax=Strongyloides stercoralis TaxID=6248 RepID=A0AAF5CSD9_STRER